MEGNFRGKKKKKVSTGGPGLGGGGSEKLVQCFVGALQLLELQGQEGLWARIGKKGKIYAGSAQKIV